MHPVETVRIFLSSPGDVDDERAQVRDLLLGLARGPYVRGRVHIDVVSWDDPHGGTTMDARLTPQQAVDRSLPTPGECDLTVVLLWSRMGTPLSERKTDGTPYLSGTEWEFDNALAANKPVFLYRGTEKVLLDPDDPGFDDKLTQKRRVDAFFERFKGDGGTFVRGFATYGSAADLLARLRADVERYLSERLLAVDVGGTAARKAVGRAPRVAIPAAPPEVPVAYREWVKKQHGGVDLLGLQLKKGRPPSLSAIYVPQTTHPASGIWAVEQVLENEKTWTKHFHNTMVLQRLGAESLYVSGAPGTGKSTFCRWVAWLVAEGTIPSLDVPPPDQFTEVLDDRLKGQLPVLLRLREFWEYLPPRVGAGLTISDLEDSIATWLEKRRPDGLDSALFRAHLTHGSVLLLLDGVDEVPVGIASAAGRWLPRHQLLSALADACPTWTKAGNRVLLTSRPYGLSAEQAVGLTLGLAPLSPLPDELQQLLARRWFAVLSADVNTGAETAAALFANIGSQPWLVDLASNPLLLTAMCIVFDEGKRLPQDKHELYERVVSTVLFSRYQDPADIDRVKRELGVIAYGMHTGTELGDRTTPKAEATFHEIEGWLQAYQERKGYTERSETGMFETREALLSHSGLLVGSGDQRAGFAHLSFQEFFAAQRAFTLQEDRLRDVFVQRAAAPEWRNTLSFLFGRLLSASTEPKKALNLLEMQIDAATDSDSGLLLVLSDAAQVLTGKGITLPEARLNRLKHLLLEVMTAPAFVMTRAEAGSAAGRLGDPRFRADRLWLPDEELLGFIRIEAGAFLMGSDPGTDRYAEDDEQPKHLVELPEYYIARYVVTVAQFQVFIEDSGIKRDNPEGGRGIPNHPAPLTFREARNYCKWLTDRLNRADWTPPLVREELAGGSAIMVPSEAQWEQAARGRDGRIYPWGNEFQPSKANCQETGLGTTTPVGMFPDGRSPCGALDMSGNVWEWTRSHWLYKYRDPNPGRRRRSPQHLTVVRVLRGGTDSGDAYLLRAAFRHGRTHDERGGLRLVFSRPRPWRPELH